MESDVKPYIHQYCLFSAIDIEKLLDSDVPNDLKMALIRKLFKRNKKISKTEETSPIYAEIGDKQIIRRVSPVVTGQLTEVEECTSEDVIDHDFKEGTNIDYILEKEETAKRKQLNNALRKASRQEERLAQRRKDVVAMDNEIAELLWMIALARRQKIALEEEVLNKKCEMKFLKKEAPECCETEVRKREPLFFKKYNAIKTSADAKNMMHTVRQRQRALQYLELMVYNKYLELQYNIKSDDVKKRTTLLSRDKSKNFGHLVEALNLRSNFETQIHIQTPTSGATPPPLTTEVFTSEPDSTSSPVTTAESPTTGVQTASPIASRDGTGTFSGLLFNLATPPRSTDRTPSPLLESML